MAVWCAPILFVRWLSRSRDRMCFPRSALSVRAGTERTSWVRGIGDTTHASLKIRYCVCQVNSILCTFLYSIHGAELSYGIVNKCPQYCTYLAVFPPFSYLRSAFWCAIFKHYVQKCKCQYEILKNSYCHRKQYFLWKKHFTIEKFSDDRPHLVF